MKTTTYQKLMVGDIFRFRPNGRLYVCESYDPITRKYVYSDYDDSNLIYECKGSARVYID